MLILILINTLIFDVWAMLSGLSLLLSALFGVMMATIAVPVEVTLFVAVFNFAQSVKEHH